MINVPLASGQRNRSAYEIDGRVLLDLTDDDVKELEPSTQEASKLYCRALHAPPPNLTEENRG